MPVQPCQINNQPGRRYGDRGACYPCKDGDCSAAAKKAAAQGAAIRASGWRESRSDEVITD